MVKFIYSNFDSINIEQGEHTNVGFGISYLTFKKNHANPIVLIAPIENTGSILVSVNTYGNSGVTLFAKNLGDYPYGTFNYKYVVLG